MIDLPSMRFSYDRGALTIADAGTDPMRLADLWMQEAIAAAADDGPGSEPNAMSLATATAAGLPSVRTVLCKDIDVAGARFVWFTNFDGRKGRELTENPHAALLFWWPRLQRQLRVTGPVQRAPTETTRAYFASRPRASQISNHVSLQQSAPVASRAELDQLFAAAETRFGEEAIPLPDHWGGFQLTATELEFWQGRESRLHDRVQFTRCDVGAEPGLGAIVTDAAGADWLRLRLQP